MSQQKALELARDGMKPLDIAAFLGIEVIFLPLKAIKGVALSIGSRKFIHIDEGLSEIEQQLVCGHELGHLLLHGDSNFMFVQEHTYYYPKQEYQANYFACQLFFGEKAELYQPQIREAASSGSLEKMISNISCIIREDGEEYCICK